MKVLATVILLACINASPAASGAKSQPLAINSERNDASVQRFLRTAPVEERRLVINLSGVGQAASGTRSWAANLLHTLQQKWSQRRMKSPNDMFTKLKLHKTGNQLFNSPSFSKWVNYVNKNSKETPEMAIFSTLAYHYSDEALAKMLDAAKKVDGTSVLATKLEKLQTTNWLYAKESPDYVFKVLALDQMGSKTFSSPQFYRWMTFMSKSETIDPEMAMYRVLGTYHSDAALAKMFAAAKQAESTRALAAQLERIQLKNWVRGGESPNAVFKALALDQMGTSIFSSPLFSRWANFVTKTSPNHPDVTMYRTLGTYYSDDILARMFAMGKQVDSTKTLATNLENIQLTNWANAGKSAESVFNTLKLDKTGGRLFESRVVNTWASYVTKTHDDPNAIMLALLKDKYHDVPLAKMIAAATKVDRMENLVVGLRSEQFKTWFSQGKKPEHVNILLNTAANTDDLTKKVSRDYEIFYGKIKVADTGARPASRPTNGIRIN